MNEAEKIECFKRIVKGIFGDRFEEWQSDADDKIIDFYHYLLDTLELELEIGLNTMYSNDISTLRAIIEILSEFHLIFDDPKLWSKNNIVVFLKDFTGIDDTKVLLISWRKFKSMYLVIKTDFLRELP